MATPLTVGLQYLQCHFFSQVVTVYAQGKIKQLSLDGLHFRLVIRKKIILGVVIHWNRLPIEVVESLPQQVKKCRCGTLGRRLVGTVAITT